MAQIKNQDWARFLEEIAEHNNHAEQITLVMDNLNTHGGAVHFAKRPNLQRRKVLLNRFVFIYTPKHGSWKDIAEIELWILHTMLEPTH